MTKKYMIFLIENRQTFGIISGKIIKNIYSFYRVWNPQPVFLEAFVLLPRRYKM